MSDQHTQFTSELQAFRARTTDPGFEGLILLGTEQNNITAGLLLGTLAVRRVAFLLTNDTVTFPAYIAGLLGCSAAAWECPPGDHLDTTQVYRSVKALRERWADITDPAKIAIDVTGGRKPMSIGLEKAAHLLGLKTVYVESDYWPRDSGKRGPIPGSQRLVIPPDPYLVFGDIEAREGMALYDAHDYQGAYRIFDRLARRVPEPDNQQYRFLAGLADAYAAWEAFDLPGAEKMLDALLAYGPEGPLASLHGQLAAQAEGLTQINALGRQLHGRSGPPLPALQDLDTILPLHGSLHTNALRREDQQRFDVAALLRYRCLELMSQQRLATHGVLTDSFDARVLLRRFPQLNSEYAAIEKQLEFPKSRGLPYGNLALLNSYMLLAALHDPLTEGLDIKRVYQQVKARNTSILAHGYRLITETEYAGFRDLVNELQQRFFQINQRDLASWEQTYRFVALNTLGVIRRREGP